MLAGDVLAEYSLAGRLPRRRGNGSPSMTPHGVYPCGAGWVFLAARDDEDWSRLARHVAADDITVDPDLATSARRHERRAEVDELVRRWTATRDLGTTVELLQSEGLPASAAFTGADIAADPGMTARGMVDRVGVATIDRTRAVCAMPWRVADRRPPYGEPPEPGRDTHAVLWDVLGMAENDVDALISAGVLR